MSTSVLTPCAHVCIHAYACMHVHTHMNIRCIETTQKPQNKTKRINEKQPREAEFLVNPDSACKCNLAARMSLETNTEMKYFVNKYVSE